MAGERQINNDEVICPNCTHQFRAIPLNMQTEIRELQLEVERHHRDFERIREILTEYTPEPGFTYGPVVKDLVRAIRNIVG